MNVKEQKQQILVLIFVLYRRVSQWLEGLTLNLVPSLTPAPRLVMTKNNPNLCPRVAQVPWHDVPVSPPHLCHVFSHDIQGVPCAIVGSDTGLCMPQQFPRYGLWAACVPQPVFHTVAYGMDGDLRVFHHLTQVFHQHTRGCVTATRAAISLEDRGGIRKTLEHTVCQVLAPL